MGHPKIECLWGQFAPLPTHSATLNTDNKRLLFRKVLKLFSKTLQLIFPSNYEDDFDMDDDLDQDDIAALKGENNVENSLTKSLSYFTGTGGSSDDEDSSTFY